MEEQKSLIQSKTFWGGLMIIVNSIAKQLGYDLGDLSIWADLLFNLAGASLAVYGRVKATKKIAKVV